LDASATSPGIVAGRYQALFEKVFAAWLDGALPPGADAADSAAIINWVCSHPLDAQTVASAPNAIHSSLDSIRERRQAIESQLKPPLQALALADGSGEN